MLFDPQHEPASLQDLPFHLKSARIPRLTESMSFASPHSPNSGSSSPRHPTREFLFLYRFRFAAVGTSPSAHHGFIRGAIALHSLESSGQHRPQLCGPAAVPCPYECEQRHEESGGTDHAVRCDPFLTQSPAARGADSTPSPCRAPRNNQTPDHAVFPNGVHPIQLQKLLYHPGDEVPKSGDGR